MLRAIVVAVALFPGLAAAEPLKPETPSFARDVPAEAPAVPAPPPVPPSLPGVAKARELWAGGKTVPHIAQALNAEGLRAPSGGAWTELEVRAVLRGEAYVPPPAAAVEQVTTSSEPVTAKVTGEPRLMGAYVGLGVHSSAAAIAGYWSEYVGFEGSIGLTSDSLTAGDVKISDDLVYSFAGRGMFGVSKGRWRPWFALGLRYANSSSGSSEASAMLMQFELAISVMASERFFIALSPINGSVVLDSTVSGTTANISGSGVQLLSVGRVGYVF